MEPQQLHVAVFGGSGSGKTVLLAAFYRAQTQPDFQARYAYKIQATDKGQGSELLGRFFSLEDGRFPDGSTRFDDYVFDFYAQDIREPGLRVHWYDYPGKWWESTPTDTEEKAAMDQALLRLGRSQVGMLIADGAKFKAEGTRYIRWLLEHFSDECDRLRRIAGPDNGGDVDFPREWILALSKADLHPETYTAAHFQRDVCRDAGSQLRKLSEALNGRASGTNGTTPFGDRYMILSSVSVTDGNAIDPHKTVGVRVLSPAILMSTLEGAAREAQRRAKDKSWGESLLEGLRGLVRMIDSIDNFLPKKYQVITLVLKAVRVEDILDARIDRLKGARDDAIKKGDAFKAVVNGMAVALNEDEGKRAYYRNQ